MPIDLELQKSEQEQALDELLKKRVTGLPSDIESIRAKVEGGRDLFAPVSPYLSSLGVQPGGLSSLNQFQSSRLSRELSKNLAASKYNQGRSILGLQGANIGRRADESYGMRVGATDFARTQSNLAGLEAFQAGQSELDRQNKLFQDSIASDFAERGLDLENRYADEAAQNSYESALMRLLGATVGTVGTAVALRNRPKLVTAAPNNPTYQRSDFIPPELSLTAGAA